MMNAKLKEVRDALLRLKTHVADKATKVAISEVLAIFDADERLDDTFADWCERHAPNWNPSEDERQVMLLLLANGSDGVMWDEIARLTSGEGSDGYVGEQNNGRIRTFVWRFRRHLAESGSTVTLTCKGGIYRTTESNIVGHP